MRSAASTSGLFSSPKNLATPRKRNLKGMELEKRRTKELKDYNTRIHKTYIKQFLITIGSGTDVMDVNTDATRTYCL